ncbi:MAG: hypothetical protein AAGD10_06435 [Myxococcota bacterium]
MIGRRRASAAWTLVFVVAWTEGEEPLPTGSDALPSPDIEQPLEADPDATVLDGPDAPVGAGAYRDLVRDTAIDRSETLEAPGSS